MKRFILLISIASAFLVTVRVSGQEPGKYSFSLKQAQDYALKNNVTMKNSQIDIELAKKKIWETTAIGLPQVSASGSYQHIFNVPVLSFPGTEISNVRNPYTTFSGTKVGSDSVFLNYKQGTPVELGVKDNASVTLNVSQLIFSGEYIVGLQATKVFYQISQNSYQSNAADIRETVANSYFLVLLLERNRKILSESLDNMKKTLGDLQEMNKVGFIENTDVDQLELAVHNIENGLRSIDNQVIAAYDLLKFQMGIPFENNVELTEDFDKIVASSDVASIITRQFRYEDHINYKILENQEAVGELNLKRQKSAYLPTLAAFYRHTENARKADFDFTMKDIAGLQLNVPIFSSGQRNVQVQQRVLELDKVRNTKTNVANGLQLDYISSRNNLTTAYDQYLIQQRSIELSRRIYEKTLDKYKEGISSSKDLTDSQNQYLDAQKNYFTSLYNLLTAKNKLEKLLNIQ